MSRTTSPRRLPSFVLDLLGSPPQRGSGLHNWLFRVARVLHPYREYHEIMETLKAVTWGQPVQEREIEEAVRDSAKVAWHPGVTTYPQPSRTQKVRPNKEQREAIITKEGDMIDLWESSPIKWDSERPNTDQIIDALFSPACWLCLGQSARVFSTRKKEEWKGHLEGMQLIVPSPQLGKSGLTQNGRMSEHAKSNVGPRRFLVIEQDEIDNIPIPKDEQAAIILHLSRKAPLSLVVDSGGKSLHAWFFCAGEEEESLKRFMRHAISLGADPRTWQPSQFVRLPDGTRDNGNRQAVLFFNPYSIN